MIQSVLKFLQWFRNHQRFLVALLTIELALFVVVNNASDLAIRPLGVGGIQPRPACDWLINYEGGFVRRGLMGQFIYALSSSAFGLNWVGFSIEAFIFLMSVIFSIKILFLERRSIAEYIFFFSPIFFISFAFYDPNTVFQKETLIYISYCALLLGLRAPRFCLKRTALLGASLLFFVIAGLTHEMTALLLPFFAYALWQEVRSASVEEKKRIYSLGGAFLALGMLILFSGVVFHGSSSQLAAFFDSLKVKGLEIGPCEEVVEWLEKDLVYAITFPAREITLGRVLNVPYIVFSAWPYVWAGLLGVLPLFMLKDLPKRLPFLLFGLLTILPLFIVAHDYGRWMSMYFTMVTLTLLSERERPMWRNVPWWCVLYCVCWSIKCCCTARLHFGLLDSVILALWGNM